MYRIRLGHPATSAVTATILATQAQITDAGLVVDLDEWGGCKTASWTGLTGGQQDRARVWLDVLNDQGGYDPVFSGTLTLRPSSPNGKREAVGDKSLRLKELPLSLATSGGGQAGPGVDAGAAMRAVAQAAQADLPHLKVGASGIPDAGVLVKRKHNGESVAAALDAFVAAKSGWGWTTRPDDSVYAGPPVSRAVTVDAATPGVQVTLRDVTSEGLRNLIRWVYTLPNGEQIIHESRHPSAATLGPSGVTRYVDQRSLPALLYPVPAIYAGDGRDGATAPISDPAVLRDGLTAVSLATNSRLEVQLTEAADWVQLSLAPQARAGVHRYTLPDGTEEVIPASDNMQTLYLPAAAAGALLKVRVQNGDTYYALNVTELNPLRLDRALLDTAAEDLYHIPADLAGTVSVLGRKPPAGSLTLKRPGLPDITEKVVGTRYVLRQPLRTEYLIGEPDTKTDDQVAKVLIQRKDEAATDAAVNTVIASGSD